MGMVTGFLGLVSTLVALGSFRRDCYLIEAELFDMKVSRERLLKLLTAPEQGWTRVHFDWSCHYFEDR